MTKYFPNRQRLFAFLLFVIPFFVFSQALQSTFVEWDDPKLYNNPHLTGINWQSIYWMFTDMEYVPRYLPLTWLGLEINFELGGLNPFGYHLGNLLLHSFNTSLVFVLLCKLFRTVIRVNDKPVDGQNMFFLGSCALGALVWAIHPLRVEPVVWVSTRLYSQSLFFLLISLLCYVEVLTLPDENKRRQKFYWASIIAFAASLLSFQTSLGSIVVLVVLDFYVLRRAGFKSPIWRDARVRRRLLEKIPFIIIVGIMVWLTLLARFNTHGAARSAFTAESFGLMHRIAQASYIWAYYLWKSFLPIHLRPVYTTLISFNPFETQFVVSFLFLTAVTILLLWKHRKWPLLLALWICYLGLLSPMIGITEHPHYSSDRYSYIVGLCGTVLMVAFLLKLQTQQARRWAFVACAGMTLLFGLMSVVQTRVWQNSIALFSHTVKELQNDPYRADIYRRIGSFYARDYNFAEAAKAYEQALLVTPENIPVRQELGKALFKLGKINEAKFQFNEAIRRSPADTDLRNAYAVELAMKKDFPAARQEFEAATRVDPLNPDAFHNIGLLLKKQGKLDEAKVYFDKADQLRNPSKPTKPATAS